MVSNNNYYPFSWVEKKLGEKCRYKIKITPGDKKSWNYSYSDESGEGFSIETNARHSITSVIYTPFYKGLGLSLKRAMKKRYKLCRYNILDGWLDREI